MTLDYVLRKSLSRDPHCFRAWRQGDGYVIDGSLPEDREEFLRQYRQAAEAEIANMRFADGYAERGCDQPRNGVLIANWNVLAKNLDRILERMGYDVEWSDEWALCEDCNRAVRTQPDSFDWKPSYRELEGAFLCEKCAKDHEEDETNAN